MNVALQQTVNRLETERENMLTAPLEVTGEPRALGAWLKQSRLLMGFLMSLPWAFVCISPPPPDCFENAQWCLWAIRV